MKEAKDKLVAEIMKLNEQVKKAKLPLDLSIEIKKASADVLEGKDTDQLSTAFLILAFDIKMYELKDETDQQAINALCKLMKLKSAYVFDALGAAMMVGSILNNGQTD